MTFTWDELIRRARTYLDDDHDDTEGWIAPDSWLTFGNVEYSQLYRRWVRMGLIAPAPTDLVLTDEVTSAPDCLAIVGVAQDYGDGRVRILTPAQSVGGRSPFWGTTSATGGSTHWSATGSADELEISLEPVDTSGSYFVRYIPTVAYATDVTETIDLPYGADERLVLGMAKRAKLKEGAASAQLERLIFEADAELNFAAFSRAQADSPRVRRVTKTTLSAFPGPASYRYL